MTENIYKCKCGKIIPSWRSYSLRLFKHHNDVCEACYVKNKGLIKCDGHYVPWNYRNHTNITGDSPADPKNYEDVNASLPEIEWCEEYKKWKVSFAAGDSGGYDVCHIVWYFDTKEEIFDAMLVK